MPGVEIVSADKLLHALAFGGMQLVFLRALRFELPRWTLSKQNLGALALASGVGGLLELYQMALPHRSAELYDWVADTLGALLAAGAVAFVARLRKPACPSERDGGA
jgi:VanZ family protein